MEAIQFLRWPRRAIPFCQSRHFPAWCFQSEHFQSERFHISNLNISNLSFSISNFESWYDMPQPSMKSVKHAIHWNCWAVSLTDSIKKFIDKTLCSRHQRAAAFCLVSFPNHMRNEKMVYLLASIHFKLVLHFGQLTYCICWSTFRATLNSMQTWVIHGLSLASFTFVL